MKLPPFAYAKPRSLDEALELLGNGTGETKAIAGGQSLIPSLSMRLSAPDLLVDITGLSELSEISLASGALRIGALATHAQVARSELVRKHVPLLAQAVPHIAHAAIRNRGTLGGSLALADPAAEYPACALALDATIVICGVRGERRTAATGFFKGLFETDLAAGELIVAAEFPLAAPRDRAVFLELARRAGDYAIIGLAAVASASGRRLAFLGAGPTPVLARKAAGAASLEEARRALGEDLDPPADLYNASATKLHLARTLLQRAWNTLSTSH